MNFIKKLAFLKQGGVLPRENFTAEFDRYDSERMYKRIYFKNVKNVEGEFVKEHFWISWRKGKQHNLVNNMAEGEIVPFSAELQKVTTYQDGYKLVRPIILITKK